MASAVGLAADALRIRDFSDRELLHVMLDESSDGAVDTRRIAIRVFGLSDSEENTAIIQYYTRCVGSRFAWMRRFGLVDKGDTVGTWIMSSEGASLISNDLNRSLANSLDSLENDRSLALANRVGLKLVSASDTASTAMKRELLFQIERRKKGAR